MTYKETIENAKAQGNSDEHKMWKSIDLVSDLLESLKDEHSDIYWDFMRKHQGIMSDGHYDMDFAEYDVNCLEYEDRDGTLHKGARWTMNEILTSTAGLSFDNDVTDFDKYVAFNTMYALLCKSFTDDQIINAAYLFFFKDPDWKGGSKIYHYHNS